MMNVASGVAVTGRGNFIDGQETVPSGHQLLDVRNPATGVVIATIPDSTREDVDAAIRSARAAFEGDAWGGMDSCANAPSWSTGSPTRSRPLLPELYRLETLNNGRPVNETRAQLARLPDFLRYFAGRRAGATRRRDPGRGQAI